jgi:hypothetical protein
MPRTSVRHGSPGTGTSTAPFMGAYAETPPHPIPAPAFRSHADHARSRSPSALPHHHAPSAQHVPLMSRAAWPAGPS